MNGSAGTTSMPKQVPVSAASNLFEMESTTTSVESSWPLSMIPSTGVASLPSTAALTTTTSLSTTASTRQSTSTTSKTTSTTTSMLTTSTAAEELVIESATNSQSLPTCATLVGWCTNFQECFPSSQTYQTETPYLASTLPNDYCAHAIKISDGGLPISTSDLPVIIKGSTLHATSDYEDFCGVNKESRGVWFSYASDITSLIRLEYQLYVKGFASSKLSLFHGTCTELYCYTHVDGKAAKWFTFDYNAPAYIDFVAQKGVTFYFLLSGEMSDTVGEYDLRIGRHSGTCEEAKYVGGYLVDKPRQLRGFQYNQYNQYNQHYNRKLQDPWDDPMPLENPVPTTKRPPSSNWEEMPLPHYTVEPPPDYGEDSPDFSDMTFLEVSSGSNSLECSLDGLWNYFTGPGEDVQIAVMVNSTDPTSLGSISIFKGECDEKVCLENVAAQTKSYEFRESRYNSIIFYEFFAERCERYSIAYSGWNLASTWTYWVFRKSCDW